MKLTWKNSKKRPLSSISRFPNLPFEDTAAAQAEAAAEERKADAPETLAVSDASLGGSSDTDAQHAQLADAFQAEGEKLAEDGKFREAFGKWEAALNLRPERAVLHEQKAQVLLEIGQAWNALKAATRATELEPSWAEAWITLGRAQLNFREPDEAIISFDTALAIKPDCTEALDDRRTALRLVKKRKLLHSSGSTSADIRYVVGEATESS